MGVTGLWTVVQPCARPIKIETLNRKRLAVDASIWIYAFLKAVRDKEGNALRNSHVVGFYRRICKLLYIGILPVFVFDGGAPALKRQTINSRKQRREGRRDDATRTAGKLLALQMQRRAEEEDQKRREAATRPLDREEEEVPDEPVYADELHMSQQERERERKFKKTDQYHLPALDVSLSEMGHPNDPRVMSLEELENYARQFDSGEDINVYDFSKIDFESPFFQSLPATDRYNILNAARLRSRLRMGLSKDQLDHMFPDRMAFSRFQVERVRERNELTQRLMNINGMTDDPTFGIDGTGRIAGEKGREYVLVKNAGVEGGWALGVIGDKDEGARDKPINVDEYGKKPVVERERESDDEDDDFEDVPIEGLNRLSNSMKWQQLPGSETTIGERDRTQYYRSRNTQIAEPGQTAYQIRESDSLFIDEPTKKPPVEDDDAELQLAIAMSLENDGKVSSPEVDEYEEVFDENNNAADAFTRGQNVNPGPSTLNNEKYYGNEAESDDEDDMEFENVLTAQVALAKPSSERQSNLEEIPLSGANRHGKPNGPSNSQPKEFDGPLPFEKLDLGSSILGKKKMKKLQEDEAGGFEKPSILEQKKPKSAPLPPWFSTDLEKGMKAQDVIEKEDREKDQAADRAARAEGFQFQRQTKLQKSNPTEIIDVDARDAERSAVINIDSSDDEESGQAAEEDNVADDLDGKTDDTVASNQEPSLNEPEIPASIELHKNNPSSLSQDVPRLERSINDGQNEEADESYYEWEESDNGEPATAHFTRTQDLGHKEKQLNKTQSQSRSPSLEFEDVELRQSGGVTRQKVYLEAQHGAVDLPEEYENPPDISKPLLDESDDEAFGSEDEDEQLMLQMADEAEEHARFASTLNSRSTRQNIEDFERELKNLQSQQKKDRRDADEVTQTMITECQQLLKLFGLPYITAPMEAEAQCAELVSLGLVDGIVTDDSDIFLFGGTRIYKNMFNAAKFVECYLSSDLEREFDLTREKMIRIAHLLGSDYTEGLPGVGPVTALEIISEFPDGLEEFRDWWTRVQMGEKATDEDNASPFRRKFRRNAARLFLPPVFPDQRVDAAYLEPNVDSDATAFQWGVPDLDALRAFLMATIGWSPERTDEVLLPVIRDMNRRGTEGTQVNITRYIGGSSGAGAVGGGGGSGANAFAPRRADAAKSKRMESALEKLAARARARKREAGAAVRSARGDGEGHSAAAPNSNVADDGNSENAPMQTGRSRKGNTAGKRKGTAKSKERAMSEDSEPSDDESSKRRKPKRKKPAKESH